MGWAGHVACMWERCIWDLMGKPEERGPLGNPWRRWEGNIFRKWDGAWNGLIWLRIRTGGSILCMG